MNRREFVSMTPLAVLAAQAGGPQPADAAQAVRPVSAEPPGEVAYVDARNGLHPFRFVASHERPNIFIVTLDMVTPDHYLPTRSLSHEMELPTIRGLMSDGVHFTNAFCTVPVCSPSRASLWTGRHPYVLGNGGMVPQGQESILRDNDVIFPEYLKAVGYRTKHIGKNHTGARKFMDAFDELDSNYSGAMPRLQEDESYHAYLEGQGIKLPRYAQGRDQIWMLAQDRKTPIRSLGGWIEQPDGSPCPIEGQYSWYLCQWAIRRTREALQTPGRPLYLQLNIYDPHNPFTIPDGFRQREDQLRRVVKLPPSYLRTVARDFKPEPGEPALLDYHRRFWGLYSTETATNYLVAHALQMEVIDRALAQFIQNLKALKIYDESWIFLTADHGEMNMHHALVDKGAYFHPDTQRVPLVVKPPASTGIPPGVIEAPVSLLDISATVCEATGIVPEERQDGRSLLPYLRREADGQDRDLLFQASWLNTGNPGCGTQRWERNGRHHFYAHNLGSASDELYDMTDPDAGNIASDPSQKAVLKEMVERMDAILGSDSRFRYYRGPLRLMHYSELQPSDAGRGGRRR